MAQSFATVEEYVRACPADARVILEEILRRIRALLPESVETISYQIPTITLHGRRIVHVAAWKQHISVYPVPDGDAAFRADIAPYLSGKGTARFLLREPIPYGLIERAVLHLV